MNGAIKTTTGPRILLVACLSLVGAVTSVTSARAGDDVTPPPVPGNLQVPEGSRAFVMDHAVGTQNYICLGAGLPWTFIGPQATLFNDEAEQALTHFLSPNPVENGVARATWQHSRDTSTVWAMAIASSSDPVYVASGAIPWLLLRVVAAQSGPNSGDKISATTFIHRVNTVGGSAPAGGCPAVGARAFVPYETDYVFYKN
jgi:hypothetical protein